MQIQQRFVTAVRLIRVRNSIRSAQRGFTLLETMIVLALIGLIAGAIGVPLYGRYRDGQIRTAKMQVGALVGHIQQFMVMKNTCPTVEDLVKEHYVRDVPQDPWGSPLLIRCPGEHEKDPADVVSFGPDKKADTPDDLKSWQL